MQYHEIALPEQRRRLLLEVLAKDGKLVAADLSRQLDVSEDTIRRDLNELAAAGLLRRVHGGALPALPLTPAAAPFTQRQRDADTHLPAFGAALAAMIRHGETVLLDGGTTMLAVAQALPADLHATIITPNLPAAVILLDHPGIELIVLGGVADKREQMTGGTAVWESVADLCIDLCLLGICAIDAGAGLMETTQDAARLKLRMIKSAQRVATAASAHKLGTRAPFRVGPASMLTTLVTDASVTLAELEPYRQLGIAVDLVN